MPQSHHSHSGQFCKHASGSLEDVVMEAIHQRFKVYGLTEHVPRYTDRDLYPEEEGISLGALAKQFDDFIIEAHRLKHVYASRITLLVGLETENITPTDLDCLQALLSKHGRQIEYIVGSVHHVNSIPIDFDLATYQTAVDSFPTYEEYLVAYFDAQYNIITRFHPEIIGHLDLCKLYNPELRISAYPTAWARLQRNIKAAIAYGALFELNAAAFRKGWHTAYPSPELICMIRSYSGKFALSDDSHGPHAVGLNYHRLAAYLHEVGVDQIWYLVGAEEANAGGRFVRAEKVGGNWWEDGFWDRRGIEGKAAS